MAPKQVERSLTNGVLNSQTVKLRFRQTTPNLGLANFVRILQTSVDAHNLVDEHINGKRMLLILLVNRERLFVQTMLDGNACNFRDVVVSELLDITDDFALVRTDRSEQEEVLEVLVLAEGRGFEDNLFQEFNEFNGKVGSQERLDGDRYIVCICTLRHGSRDDLHQPT